MMGVGKSTIGQLLSKKFNIQFEDIDEIIGKRMLQHLKKGIQLFFTHSSQEQMEPV